MLRIFGQQRQHQDFQVQSESDIVVLTSPGNAARGGVNRAGLLHSWLVDGCLVQIFWIQAIVFPSKDVKKFWCWIHTVAGHLGQRQIIWRASKQVQVLRMLR